MNKITSEPWGFVALYRSWLEACGHGRPNVIRFSIVHNVFIWLPDVEYYWDTRDRSLENRKLEFTPEENDWKLIRLSNYKLRSNHESWFIDSEVPNENIKYIQNLKNKFSAYRITLRTFYHDYDLLNVKYQVPHDCIKYKPIVNVEKVRSTLEWTSFRKWT